MKYGIVCPVDSIDGSTTMVATTDAKAMKFTKFEVPFYIGSKTKGA